MDDNAINNHPYHASSTLQYPSSHVSLLVDTVADESPTSAAPLLSSSVAATATGDDSESNWDEAAGRMATELMSDGGGLTFSHLLSSRSLQLILVVTVVLWLLGVSVGIGDTGSRLSNWHLSHPDQSNTNTGEKNKEAISNTYIQRLRSIGDRNAAQHSHLLIHSEWQRLSEINGTWCHYPLKRTSFQFDEEKYHIDYMPKGETCSSLESKSASSPPSDSALSFDAQVNSLGELTVTGCANGSLWYTTEYDRGGPGIDGGWRGPSVESRHPLGDTVTASPVRKKLNFPTSFVFVGCDAKQKDQQSPKYKFLTVHTPIPSEVLTTRPKPTRASSNSKNEVPRRNLILIQLDALSTPLLPVLMPRTYALLESMRVGSVSANPSFDPPLPSVDNYESYRFTKNALSGSNSPPSFFSLYGNGDWDHIPNPDSNDWMWKAAQQAGYRTGFGEDNCGCSKYRMGGIAAETINASRYMDFNAMLPACALPDFVFSSWEKQYHTRRCFQGRGSWRYVWDMLRMALEEPAKTEGGKMDSNKDGPSHSSDHPLFFMLNFLAAHEMSGALGRHFDDDLFADELAQLLSVPAMRDNGLVLVFSDHGLHYGDYALASGWGVEEHMDPFLYLLAPRHGKGALEQREREALESNRRKLTNPYDWYRTFMSQIRNDAEDLHDQPSSSSSSSSSSSISESESRADMSYDDTANAPLDRTYNLLREVVPAHRSCAQLRMPTDAQWNPARKLAPYYCLCESPYSRLCQPHPTDLSSRLWQECTELWAHPLLFDAEFYARVHGPRIIEEDEQFRKEADQQWRDLQSRNSHEDEITQVSENAEWSAFHGTSSSPSSTSSPLSSVGPCRALHHWCTVGAYQGLQSSPTFHISALAYFHPKHTQNSQNILAWGREFINWGHHLSNPPLRTLFSDASAGRAHASEQLSNHCPRRTIGDVEGSRVWFRTVATGSWCPEVTMDASFASKLPDPYASPLQWTNSLTPLSDDEYSKLIQSAVYQCNHWCMFDVHSEQIRGWEVRGPGCLFPFADDKATKGNNATNETQENKSLCVTAYAALREQVLAEIQPGA